MATTSETTTELVFDLQQVRTGNTADTASRSFSIVDPDTTEEGKQRIRDFKTLLMSASSASYPELVPNQLFQPTGYSGDDPYITTGVEAKIVTTTKVIEEI